MKLTIHKHTFTRSFTHWHPQTGLFVRLRHFVASSFLLQASPLQTLRALSPCLVGSIYVLCLRSSPVFPCSVSLPRTPQQLDSLLLFASNIVATCRFGHLSSYDPSFVAALSLLRHLRATGNWHLQSLPLLPLKPKYCGVASRYLKFLVQFLLLLSLLTWFFEIHMLLVCLRNSSIEKYIQGAWKCLRVACLVPQEWPNFNFP